MAWPVCSLILQSLIISSEIARTETYHTKDYIEKRLARCIFCCRQLAIDLTADPVGMGRKSWQYKLYSWPEI